MSYPRLPSLSSRVRPARSYRRRLAALLPLALSGLLACSVSQTPGDADGGVDGDGDTVGDGDGPGDGDIVGDGDTTGDGDGDVAGDGDVLGDGDMMGDGDVAGDGDGAPIDCATLQRPPTPLRRLTRFEYDNSVRDLFGIENNPSAAFPPDEIADGFSNNALVLTISDLHAEKYMEAAEAVGASVAQNLAAVLPCDPAMMGEEACAQSFAQTVGRRAFRRALEPGDLDVLMAAYAVGSSFEKGIEIMVRAMLQSPSFLFRVEFTGADVAGSAMVRLSGHETAARLSYLIWSSIPDDVLLDAAAAGELSTAAQVEAQARRMLQDPKARVAVTEFYRQWTEINRLPTINKDPTAFPLWDDALRAAMQSEGTAVVEHVLWGEEPTLSRLLTAPLGLPSGPLATLYGMAESSAVVDLPASERSGLLTLPSFLSVQAHPDQTSPVLRGRFVRAKLLCTDVPPPPDDVDPTPPEETEGQTARVRFDAHAATPSCANCHKLMDPLGFTLESYDSIGTYRTTDQGMELDLSGEFVDTEDLDGPFVGVQQMTQMLAGSRQVEDCVTEQWYKYTMGRGSEDGDVCSLAPLQNVFSQSGGNLSELVVKSTQTEAFLYRRASMDEVAP